MWSFPPCETGLRSRIRTIVTSVVSRIGIARISSGSSTVATVVPATVQLDASANDASAKPSTWLPESPMNTWAARPGRRLNGRKPDAREPERDREREHGVVRVLGRRVDREVRAGDRRQRRREPVHVVEQVERVRDPDEPEDPDTPREHVVSDDLDLEPAREHDHRGADLEPELDERAQVAQVVDEAGGEEERGAREDAAELAAPLERAGRERDADAGDEAEEDADAAEGRRGRLVPALPARVGDQPAAERRAQEDPKNPDGDGQRGDRESRFHSQEA